MRSIYSKGKTIDEDDLYKQSAKRKLKEIAVLEEYIGKCKSTLLQEIAGRRMNDLIKEIVRWKSFRADLVVRLKPPLPP